MPKYYEGIGPERGEFVREDEALAYAMRRCGITFAAAPGDTAEEFKTALLEWFFSGNWIKEEISCA